MRSTSSILLLLAAHVTADLVRPRWKPFAIDKRNVTTSSPLDDGTPTTTSSSTSSLDLTTSLISILPVELTTTTSTSTSSGSAATTSSGSTTNPSKAPTTTESTATSFKVPTLSGSVIVSSTASTASGSAATSSTAPTISEAAPTSSRTPTTSGSVATSSKAATSAPPLPGTGYHVTYSPSLSDVPKSLEFTYSPSSTTPPGTAPVQSSSSLTSGVTSSLPGRLPSNSSSLFGTGTTAPTELCTGATLNVLSASLDWWYTQTYTFVATTFMVQFDADDVQTGWTVIPATTSFEVASALADPSCSYVTTYDTYYSENIADQICVSTPPPVAAATTVVSQTAFRPINETTGTGTSLPDVVITPAPASVAIPNSGGNFSAGTPFVFFSAYEIMTKRPTTFGNGKIGCAETTSVYNMSSPFSFEFTGGDVNGSVEVNAGVTGDVNPAFLGIVNVTNAIAGSWVAEPTVVVVVVETVAAMAVLAAHTEESASNLETPTPTLPPGISLVSTQPDQPGTYPSPHVESTQASLIVPTAASQVVPADTSDGGPTITSISSVSIKKWATFIAHIESSDSTLVLPTATDDTVITTSIGGEQVTATAVGAVVPTTSAATSPSGPNLAGLISAAISAAVPTTPTDALQVLSQALASAGDPAASAIVAGLGGGLTQVLPSVVTAGSGSSVQANPVLTIGGSTVTGSVIGGQSPTAIVVAGQTASAGGSAITVNGQQVSVASGVTAVIVGSSTKNLISPVTAPAALTVNGQTLSSNGGATYVISGQTLTPGGAITISAAGGLETISLNSAANQLITIQNGHTSTSSIGGVAPSGASALTIGGSTYTAVSSSGSGGTYIISGQTLTPGGVITLGSETLSLAPGGTALITVSAGHTTTSTISSGNTAATAPPILTIGGQTFTALNGGATYVIDGQTLTPGGIETITLGGQVYIVSLAPSTSVLEIELVGSGGHVTATTFATLIPAAAAPTDLAVTVTNTLLTGGAGGGATARSSASTGGPTATAGVEPGLVNGASRVCGGTLAVVVGAVLALVGAL